MLLDRGSQQPPKILTAIFDAMLITGFKHEWWENAVKIFKLTMTNWQWDHNIFWNLFHICSFFDSEWTLFTTTDTFYKVNVLSNTMNDVLLSLQLFSYQISLVACVWLRNVPFWWFHTAARYKSNTVGYEVNQCVCITEKVSLEGFQYPPSCRNAPMLVFSCFTMAQASQPPYLLNNSTTKRDFKSNGILCISFSPHDNLRSVPGPEVMEMEAFLFPKFLMIEVAKRDSAGPARHCCVAPPFFFYNPLSKHGCWRKRFCCRCCTQQARTTTVENFWRNQRSRNLFASWWQA